MTINQIRKDLEDVRQRTQTFLVEPEWLIKYREIQKLLDVQEKLRKQLTFEEMHETAQEVAKDYAERKGAFSDLST